MNISESIKFKLTEKFLPSFLDIKNVSHLHAHHKAMIDLHASHDQTHFNIIIVSDTFKGISLIARHRLIYSALQQEIQFHIHALAIKAFTKDEYIL